jgi:uncharacterized delta-60 repeat protein
MKPLLRNRKRIFLATHLFISFAVISFIAFLSSPAQAAVITWATGTSADWNMPAAWVGNVVPTASDDVVIPASSGDTITVYQTIVTVSSMTVGSGSTVVITMPMGTNASSITSANGYTNNGILQLIRPDVSSPNLTVTNGNLINNIGATITDSGSTISSSSINADIINRGLLDVTKGITINKTSGVHSSNGTISIASGATLDIQAGGTLTVKAEGVLQGSGTLLTSSPSQLISYGTIRPGGAGATGTLTLSGGGSHSGIIEAELSSTSAYDTIAVPDQLSTYNFSGTLRLISAYTGTYTPGLGDSFVIIDGLPATSFNVNSLIQDYPVLGGGKNWQTTPAVLPISTTAVTVTVISDVTNPTVISSAPAGLSSGVPVNYPISATFSEAMDPATINSLTFTVSGATGNVTYDAVTRTTKFTPVPNLSFNTIYTAMITTGAQDLAGNGLSTSYSWNFTTQTANLLTVLSSGTGTGAVRSLTAGIDCGGDCTELYGTGSTITLVATPAAGSYFSGWTGPCNGGAGSQALTCMVTMDADKTVTALFTSGTQTAMTWAQTVGVSGSWDELYRIRQTADGGYITAGVTYKIDTLYGDAWVTGVNPDGTIAWQKSYGGSNADYANDIQQTADGGYILAGATASSGAGAYDAWVVKLNADGTVAWQNTYGGSGDEWLSSIMQTADGGFFATGYSNSFAGSYDAWLLKLNSDGSIAWQKTLGGANYDFSNTARQTADGGYILAGDTDSSGSGGYDGWVVKLNVDGSIAWQKTYGGSGYDYLQDIEQTLDGGYIVAGGTYSFDVNGDGWLLKLNSDGTTAWQKTYGGANAENFNSVHQTVDGGYIVAGYTDSFGTNGDAWLLKLNSDGSIAWERSYGGTSYDYPNSVQEAADGGYIVVGYTEDADPSGDAWMFKTDANGSIVACSSLLTGTTAASVAATAAVPANAYSATLVSAGTTTSSASTVTDTLIIPNMQCTGVIYHLTVTKSGIGAGTVRSRVAGIDCGGTCSADFAGGSVMILTAATGTNSAFGGWTGECTGGSGSQSLECIVTMDKSKTVTAVFNAGNPSQTAWSRTYGGAWSDTIASSQQTADGGYILAGTSNLAGSGFWVVKLNATGSVMWQKVYGTGSSESASSILQTADGGYLVTYATCGDGCYGALLMKLHADGSIDWQKSYNSPYSNGINAAQQTSDGGYIIAGYTYTSGNGDDAWLLKLNAAGGVQWQKAYGGTGYDYARSVRQTSDGGYIFAGYSYVTLYDAWVVKVDAVGTITWDYKYSTSPNASYAYDIQQTLDNGYIVAGESNSDLWVLKLNQDGTLSWQKTYGGAGADLGNAIRQINDGGYIVAGTTSSFGAGGTDAWLLNLDSGGNVIWANAYGGIYEDQIFSVSQTADNGYVAAGYTDSFGAGGYDAWVLKFRSDGVMTFQSASGASSLVTAITPTDSTASNLTTGAVSTDTTISSADTVATATDTTALSQRQAPAHLLTVALAGSGTGTVRSQVAGSNGIDCGLACTDDYIENSMVVLNAVPAAGSSFTGWTGPCYGGTGSQSLSCLVTLSSNMTVTANFSPSPPAATSWAKTIGGGGGEEGNDIQQTSDGGYIVVGYSDSFSMNGAGWATKFDAAGVLQWQKLYSDPAIQTTLRSVQQTADNGYIMAGYSNNDLWVLKTDTTGTIQWQNTYGGTYGEQANAIQQTLDGGYIVAGQTNSFGNGLDDAWILKLDVVGNVLWQKTYGNTDYNYAYTVQQTRDGGFVVAGYDANLPGGWLAKLDTNGNTQWQRTFGTGSAYMYYQIRSVQQTADDGFILAGSARTISLNDEDIWIAKLDVSGNLVWDYAYHGANDESAASIRETADGGFIAAGQTTSFGAGSTDAWVLKTGPTGSVQWQQSYGWTNYDSASSIRETADGGYIFVGRTYSFGDQNYGDVWVVKLAADGLVSGCTNSGLGTWINTTAAIFAPTYIVPGSAGMTETNTSVTPASALVTRSTTSVVPALVCAPMMSLSPNNFNFWQFPVGSTTSPVTFTVTNSGVEPLTVISSTITGTNPADFGRTTTCSTVVTSASCTIDVTFTPQSSGTRNAVLAVSSDDPRNPTANASLAGTGVYTLTVVNNNMTDGDITGGCSDGCAIQCGVSGSSCSITMTGGSSFTFDEMPQPGFLFSGWGGAGASCIGSRCTIIINSDVTVSAGFISQGDCTGATFALTPASLLASFGASSGSTLVSQVTGTTTTCMWQAISDVPWMTSLSPIGGPGSGTVNYTVAAGPDLFGAISIADQKFTVSRTGYPGGLDVNFGTPTGFVTMQTGTAGASTYIQAAVLQPDKKIVVAGYSYYYDGSAWVSDNFVGRYNSNGGLDTTFGTNGIVSLGTTTLGSDSRSVAISPVDGSIVVAGYLYQDAIVTRVTSTGLLDATFGSGGSATFNLGIGYSDSYSAVAVQPDGSVVAAGTSVINPNYPAVNNMLVTRFTSTGLLDTTFGTNGVVSQNTGTTTSEYLVGLAIQPDGMIVTSGNSYDNVSYSNSSLVTRFTSTGLFDAGFGSNGIVSYSTPTAYVSNYGVAVQSDGKVVAAGTIGNAGLILRYTTAGQADLSFGFNGVVQFSPGAGSVNELYSIAVQQDGKLLIAGYTNDGMTSDNVLTIRLNTDGTSDPAFGSGGMVRFNQGMVPATTTFFADYAKVIAVQPDSRIVIAGSSYDTYYGINYGLVMQLLNDTTPPTVQSTSPADLTTNVSITTNAITAAFSEPMDQATITLSTFLVSGLTGTVTYDAPSRTAMFSPASNLAYGTTYTATITTGAKDLAGNGLAADYVWSFTTLAATYTVTATAGSGGTISPASALVSHGSTTTFTVTPNTGYTASVGGTCGGSLVGNSYTTNAVIGPCTVDATFTLNQYTVTATASSGGTISPASALVSHGSTTTFTVTPNTGYTASVGGTCGGSLVGNSYTTNAVIGPCTVDATFTLNQYTVTATAGSGGTISPASALVSHGSTTTFTVTPNTGYTASVGGTCGGSLVANTFTTNAIIGPCTVSATFTLNAYTVTASVVSGLGTISPTSALVSHGSTTTFTVTPNTGYTASVAGTCGGTLVGNTYTTNAVTGPCTVSATFTLNQYTVTATAGSGGTISPALALVSHGSTTTFTVTPSIGYTASVAGTCGGTLVGNTYTTNAITGPCTASATFTLNQYTVTATAGLGGTISPASALVSHGSTTTFTVTPNAGYTASMGGSCGGTLVGNTYTTNVITGLCTVAATFSDITPPDTTITANPVNPSNSTSASFSFTSTEAGSTFECSLDGGAFAACFSPTLYSSLSETGHTFAVRSIDGSGNSDPTPAFFSWTVDITPPAFSALTPAVGSIVNTATIAYTLSETAESCGIIITQVSGPADSNAPHTYSFSGPMLAKGSHNVDTGLPLVSGATYDIGFTAVDPAGNVGSASVTGVTFDTTSALVTIGSPLSGSLTNSTAVAYDLSENIQTASISCTRVGGASDANSPHIYDLSGSELNAGAHSIASACALVDGAVYDIAVQGIVDLAGNMTPAVTNTNITFDIASVAVTNVKPEIKSIITTPAVSYTLSEDAQSGTVTFTRTGGKPDSGAPHSYTLTSADLTAGSHIVTPAVVLTQGTFYTVTFQFQDKVGNPATTVSTGMIFFDQDYGVGPVGNVDNSDGLNIVNNTDVLKLQAAMGARPGDRNWNPVCDLDRNNVVDIRDLMILHSHYGQTGP